MPVTLQEMKKGMTDKLQIQMVDEMTRESQVLELMGFDNCISPGTGSTLTYGYMQTELPSATGFRALNTEYTATEATVTRKTVDLKIFGGAFELDRVIKEAEGRYNNMAFQLREKILSAIGTFHDTMINGDSAGGEAGTATQFDGLDKMLVGKTTEMNTGKVIDLSTITAIRANADEFYEMMMKLMNDTDADAIMVSGDMKTKIQTAARLLGYKTDSEMAFGRQVETINGKRMITLGNVYSVESAARKSAEIIGKKNRTVDGSPQTGLTDIFAVKFDVFNGFHGITLTGASGVRAYLPDFNTPGAVKKGEVEMVAAVALKNTKHAGVLRNIKI